MTHHMSKTGENVESSRVVPWEHLCEVKSSGRQEQSTMERAGNEDVERKGLGTPATRADIIEKEVKGSY